MENIGQPITVEHKDLIATLLREKQIHEGNWVIMAMLGFAPLNIGQTPTGEDASPGGAVIFQKIGIQQVSEPTPNSVDAAIVNPKPKSRSTKK